MKLEDTINHFISFWWLVDSHWLLFTYLREVNLMLLDAFYLLLVSYQCRIFLYLFFLLLIYSVSVVPSNLTLVCFITLIFTWYFHDFPPLIFHFPSSLKSLYRLPDSFIRTLLGGFPAVDFHSFLLFVDFIQPQGLHCYPD